MTTTDYLVWGIIAHLVADWILQNDWVAANKGNLKHPAAWYHAGWHLCLTGFVFPFWAAALITITHALIDTRKPAQWWQRVYEQTTEGPFALPVALWLDQVLHVVVIAILALIV